MKCPACNCAMSEKYPCRKCAQIAHDGKVIAGSTMFGALHVREFAERWTVEVAGYACKSVRIVCSTVHREHALAYHAKHKRSFGLTASR